jgi:branched-chain amino acid transport system substrate-binding protein
MRIQQGASRRAGRLQRGAICAIAGVLLLATTACSGDDDDDGAASDTTTAEGAADLLGPEDVASGEPIKLGMVSDGATDAFDNTDELRAAQAAADYFNQHKGGVGGHEIELVTCETGADPAGAADCANQFISEDVIAVALSQSAVAESVWEPLHEAGVTTLFFQGSGEAIETDNETSFLIANPLTTFFGLPISVAEDAGSDKIDFVTIDVPQALTIFEENGPAVLENAGMDYDLVAVPPGTADMTSQMQEVVDNGAGVVQVIGNDAFCIAAFQGLAAVGYTGEITSIAQCITDATREAMPDGLEGVYLLSTQALGAADDPTYQLYQAVIDEYGDDVSDVANATALGGYIAFSSLATAMSGLDPEADVTSAAAAEAIKTMDEAELPGGGGMTFQCGGSAMESSPAVCSNQWLRTTLDSGGQPTDYEPVDSSEILEGL